MSAAQQRPVALVTGGSRGIGRAIAQRLAADGHDVALTYREREDAAADVVAQIAAGGGHAVALRADLARAADVEAVFDAVQRDLGRLDVLVLNATVIPEGTPTQLSEADFDLAFAVNVKSAFLAMRRAASVLPDGGRIVTLSSGVTSHIMPFLFAYSASKAALENLTRDMAGELGPRGITANIVIPGPTETDGMVLPPGAEPMLVAQTPLGRLGRPDDIASVVSFLVSDNARWITGQRVRATGGLD